MVIVVVVVMMVGWRRRNWHVQRQGSEKVREQKHQVE